MSHFLIRPQSRWHYIAMFLCMIIVPAGTQPSLFAQEPVRPECCEPASMTVTITPLPDPCCYQITGHTNCTNPFDQVIIQEYIRYSAVPLNPTFYYADPSTGDFTINICVTSGYNLLRISLFNNSFEEQCFLDVSLPCGTVQCCDNFTIVGTSASVDLCCMKILGPGQSSGCNAATSWFLEEKINNVWTHLTSDNYFVFNTIEYGICRPRNQGPFNFRLGLKDYRGNEICSKELTYDCNDNPCCQSFRLEALPSAVSADECCFYLTGTEDPCNNPSTAFYKVEEKINDVWTVHTDFQPLVNQTFMTEDMCKQTGQTYTFRVSLAYQTTSGYLIYCVKEVEFECPPSCCDLINVQAEQPVAGECCFDITVDLPAPECTEQQPIFYVMGEKDQQGNWITATTLQGPVNPPDFSLYYCLLNGGSAYPSHLQFDFYDQNMEHFCTRNLVVECHHEVDPGEGGGGHGKTGTPSDGNDDTGLIQHLSSAPNPASDETLISYSLTEGASVSIELVDALGHTISIQQATPLAQGVHTLPLKTLDLANGMYTLVVKANGRQATINLVVAR